MKTVRTRIGSILLVLAMLLTMLPATALAEDASVGSVEDLTKALEQAKPGDTITLSEGKYDVGNNYYINEQVNLVGAGADKTVITGSIFLTQSTGNMSVSNLTMQSSGTHVALNIQGSTNGQAILEKATVTVSNCVFKDYEYTIGMNSYVKDSTLVIEDSQFINCGCATAVQTGLGNTVTYTDTDVGSGFATQSFGNDVEGVFYNEFYYDTAADLENGTPDLNAVETPITFITQAEADPAAQLSGATSGVVMFTGGTYDIGAVNVTNPISIMGAGADKTVLNGTIGYKVSTSKAAVSVSGLTMKATDTLYNSGINFSALTDSTINVSNCAFEGYQFGVGVNSSAGNNTLNVSNTDFTGTWCAMGVKDSNTVGTLTDVTTDPDCFAVQIFGRNTEDGSYDFGAFYDTVENYEENPDTPTWEPSTGTWPSSWEAKTSDGTYGSLKELVENATGATTIELLDDVTLSAAVELNTGDDITINGNGKTIAFPGMAGTGSGGHAFHIASSANGVTLNVNHVTFETTDGANMQNGTPVTGFGIVVGEATNNVSVSADYCSFSDLWSGVYFGHVEPDDAGSVAITNCTYKNVKYGYSIDESTAGSAVNVVESTFTNSPGAGMDREPSANITLTKGENTTAYATLAAALAAAADGDTITLNKDVTENVIINTPNLTINGNGHTVTGAAATDAVTVTAAGVTLNNLNVTGTGSRGRALVVGENAPIDGAITVNGGTYTTSLDTPGLQGEGAIRLFADDVTVKDTTTVGGIHVFGASKLEVTGNTVGFTYDGDVALVGILLHDVTAEVDKAAIAESNTIAVPNENSFYVQISDANWENQEEIPATDSVAKIGTNLYKTLQDAVDAVEDGETIIIIEDCAENVAVSHEVTFTLKEDTDVEFAGSISAGGGYSITVNNGVYTVEEYTPVGGGGSTTTKPVEEPKLPFTDVTGHWALDAITYVYKNGMMNGTTATKFGPEVELTRGMLVTILYRLEKEPAVSGSSAFTDVSSSMYYADAIAWAASNGIVTGYTETTFGPEDSLTREQMAAILYRYASYKSYDVTAAAENLTGFSDAAQVSTYATESVNWAVGEGLLTGVTSTTLKPQGTATRAQVATILMRFCENIAK